MYGRIPIQSPEASAVYPAGSQLQVVESPQAEFVGQLSEGGVQPVDMPFAFTEIFKRN